MRGRPNDVISRCGDEAIFLGRRKRPEPKAKRLPATAYSFALLSGTDHEPDYLAAAAEQEAGNDRGFDSNVCLIRRSDLSMPSEAASTCRPEGQNSLHGPDRAKSRPKGSIARSMTFPCRQQTLVQPASSNSEESCNRTPASDQRSACHAPSTFTDR